MRKFEILLFSLFIFMVLIGCAPASSSQSEPAPAPTETAVVTASVPPTVAASFTPLPSTATTPPMPTPSATPIAITPTPPQLLAPICPDLPRPALISGNGNRAEGKTTYELWHPDSSEICTLTIPFENVHLTAVVNDTLYFVQLTGEELPQHIRYHATGQLNYFKMPNATPNFLLPSPDGQHIAWVKREIIEPDGVLKNTLSLTNLQTNQTLELRAVDNQEEVNRGEGFVGRSIMPLMFFEDKLLFSFVPEGKGGSWDAFSGRYSNLYQIPLGGGEETAVYLCPPEDTTDCISDIHLDNQWLSIAHRTENKITVQDFAGNTLQTHQGPGEDYIGWPIFNSAGQLAFLSADIGLDNIEIEQSYLSYVYEPESESPQTILETPITYLQNWLGNEQLIFWQLQEGHSKLSVVNINGTVVPLPDSLGTHIFVIE